LTDVFGIIIIILAKRLFYNNLVEFVENIYIGGWLLRESWLR